MMCRILNNASLVSWRSALFVMLIVAISVSQSGMANAQDDPSDVYLPIILKPDIPPIAPTLDAIANNDGDGEYAIGWSASSGATDYMLEEDDNELFTSPNVPYTGSATTHNVSGQVQGTYYYRVQARNASGASTWSNVQSVTVLPPPDHYVGASPSISFDVIGNQVCNFKITVPFGVGTTCRITPECMDIASNKFGVSSSEVGAIFVIDGAFTSDTQATGDYSVTMCRNSLLIPASTGTWSATKISLE